MTHPHPTARLFVALDLPAGVRSELSAWARMAQQDAGSLRTLDEQWLHVTLCFLGDRPVDEIDAVAAVVERIAGEAEPIGELELSAPLWLPPRRPRALAIEVHYHGRGLGDLHAELVRALAGAIDWQPEQRRLRAHVTVARARPGAPPERRPLVPTPALTFEADALTLYRSHLARDGATYEALQRAEVG